MGLPALAPTPLAPQPARQPVRPTAARKSSKLNAGPGRKVQRLLLNGGESEENIHLECAAWVFAHEARFPILRWLMHVPNGGKRSRGEAGKMRAMGVRAGVADFIHPMSSPRSRYSGLAVELKSAQGRTSTEQDEFLQAADAAGWLTGVARSLDEFVVIVESWLLDRPLPLEDITNRPSKQSE